MEEIKNLKKDIKKSLVITTGIIVLFGILFYLENSIGSLSNLPKFWYFTTLGYINIKNDPIV